MKKLSIIIATITIFAALTLVSCDREALKLEAQNFTPDAQVQVWEGTYTVSKLEEVEGFGSPLLRLETGRGYTRVAMPTPGEDIKVGDTVEIVSVEWKTYRNTTSGWSVFARKTTRAAK